MRLLNTSDMALATFIGAQTPTYAILSHTWAGDELLLQDLAQLHLHRHKKGYLKLDAACARARADGHAFIWIDTVCIDKTSSAELSEAINSMYEWYQNATVCYVFLADLESGARKPSVDELADCRWFRRGWTLQELVAPRDPDRLLVFDREWRVVGNRHSLASELCEVTGIDMDCLLSKRDKALYSVAQRLSWAAKRRTTRPEDMAYCLLGIFDVNLPLLYGEGADKAFLRLQMEVLQATQDQTMFTWTWARPNIRGGLLAPSPFAFRDCHDFIPVRSTRATTSLTVSPRGISLRASLWEQGSRSSKGTRTLQGTRLLLQCRRKDRPELLCLPMVSLIGSGEWARFGELETCESVPRGKTRDVFVPHRIQKSKLDGGVLTDWLGIAHLPTRESGYVLDEWWPRDSYTEGFGIIRAPSNKSRASVMLAFHHLRGDGPPFSVFIGQVGKAGTILNLRDHRVFVFEDTAHRDIEEMYSSRFPISPSDVCSKQRSHHSFLHFAKLAQGLTCTERDGVNRYVLSDGTFVHVSLGQVQTWLELLGCVQILAGKSWEQEIRQRVNWGQYEGHMTQSLMQGVRDRVWRSMKKAKPSAQLRRNG